MDAALYLTEAYLSHFSAVVLAEHPEGVVLDRTAFYPAGGGQPCDTGGLTAATGESVRVTAVHKGPAGIVHVVDPGGRLAVGRAVVGELDWARRSAHMRYHTALHVLSGVVFRRVGSGITGNQIYTDRARMDFSIPGFDRTMAESFIEGVNAVVAEGRPVSVRFVPREEALKDPSLVRVAQELLPEVDQVRLIDIEGFDVQADGGTHVRNTAEIGTVRLDRIENKGARNKRMYLTADPGKEG